MSEVVPKVGEWAVYRDGSDYSPFAVGSQRISAVTAKMIKFGSRYPRQKNISDLLACVPDEDQADRIMQSCGGINGEYLRRASNASAEYGRHLKAAKDAGEKQLASMLKRELGE